MSTTIHAPNKVASTSGKPTRRLANRTRTKSSARSNETPVDQNSDKQPANIQQHEANTDAMDSMDDAQKKPTIRDVARLAGVSYGTVSRYLNGNTHVSQDAAERIAAAITKSQYTPNNAARSLAQRRTLTVALIIQVESNETIAQASMSRAMAGANQVLGDAGYQMVTLIANSEDSTRRIAQLVQSDFSDGYLLFSLSEDSMLANTFASVGSQRTREPAVPGRGLHQHRGAARHHALPARPGEDQAGVRVRPRILTIVEQPLRRLQGGDG